MNELKSEEGNLLPFEVIVAAVDGDTDAINQVVNHYRGYI